jgi:hypothetical protein
MPKPFHHRGKELRIGKIIKIQEMKENSELVCSSESLAIVLTGISQMTAR